VDSGVQKTATVIGAGPAGLMAAEVLSAAGVAVTVYERMPTTGRKLLMAGRGGLNLTHSEPFEAFVGRYGEAATPLRPMLEAFGPAALIAWAEGLGQPVFTGSSGRVFPRSLKASPLLRAWLARLDGQGVVIRTRHEWLGWDVDGALRLRDAGGDAQTVRPDVAILALGGASWPKLGSNGAWAAVLDQAGVAVRPLRPANGGFLIDWSDIFRDRFAGAPLKSVALTFEGRTVNGEAMIARYGIEGGAVYALSAPLRDAIERGGSARLDIDLRPNMDVPALAARLARPHAGQSVANHLRKALKLTPVEINLLRETAGASLPLEPNKLARRVKQVRLTLTGAAPIERAISTAGGVDLAAVDEHLMLRARPGVFVAGEMLDWEAPTGGYLLQATLASGVAAAKGALARLTAD
jgi:uncharacterized flavoprotein (TIGR03862 family)